MNTVISEYKLQEITDCDDTIIQQCILSAIKRVCSYLGAHYDTDKIFNATGSKRDPDILEICKNAALWYLVRRNNVDILYTRVKEVYDRDVAYLKELAGGNLPAGLPLRETGGKPISAVRAGSNPKFKHSW